jgi:hypothetical protein
MHMNTGYINPTIGPVLAEKVTRENASPMALLLINHTGESGVWRVTQGDEIAYFTEADFTVLFTQVREPANT